MASVQSRNSCYQFCGTEGLFTYNCFRKNSSIIDQVYAEGLRRLLEASTGGNRISREAVHEYDNAHAHATEHVKEAIKELCGGERV